MKEAIPVNPVVLRWARECLQLSIDDVGVALNKEPQIIADWENGRSAPTYTQLEMLAYKIYKRPLAIFFFPHPPKEEPIEETFRSLPSSELARLPSRMRLLLRSAKVLQLNLEELFENQNPSENFMLRNFQFSSRTSGKKLAILARKFLGVSIDDQLRMKNSSDAFNFWRDLLQKHGVFIFKESFQEPGNRKIKADLSDICGFCIYDPNFPIVLINNNLEKNRQIFTLFHELAHLLFKYGGVDFLENEYSLKSELNKIKIESLANEFASEFLVPSDDFMRQTSGKQVDDHFISDIANRYRVSREVILRKLKDVSVISENFYSIKLKEYKDQWINREPKGDEPAKPSYYKVKLSYLSVPYVEKVFSSLYHNAISQEQAADYLNIRTDRLPKMEAEFFRSGRLA